MKGFILSVIASLLAAVISFAAGVYLSTPFFLYEVKDNGSDINLVIHNIGLTSADNTNIELVLAKQIKMLPVIRKQYWTKEKNMQMYFKSNPADSSYFVAFNDNGELGKFDRNEKLEILFIPKHPMETNLVRAKNLDISKLTSAFVWNVESIDDFNWTIKWGVFIMILVSIAYTALGYQYANSKRQNNQII